MNEDPPSTPPQRSWLDRLSQAFSGEARSREDLQDDLRQAVSRGLITLDTLAMIEGAMQVADREVADVMVPRAQMVSLQADQSLEQVLPIIVESGHSRFPVHGDNRDDLIGILLAKDLLRCFAEKNGQCRLRDLLRPAVLIPDSKRLNVLLKEFKESRNHMAIVVDEYGGVAGLVTIEDVLEQIVGEIDDEHDESTEYVSALPDGRFEVDALMPIEDFNARFGSRYADEDYDTVGGMIFATLGQVPAAGERLALEGWLFEVAEVDARRVLRLRVEPVPLASSDAA